MTRNGHHWLWTLKSDFADSRAALDFLSHYQRADGKIPHESVAIRNARSVVH